jgi:hypothetical protein
MWFRDLVEDFGSERKERSIRIHGAFNSLPAFIAPAEMIRYSQQFRRLQPLTGVVLKLFFTQVLHQIVLLSSSRDTGGVYFHKLAKIVAYYHA